MDYQAARDKAFFAIQQAFPCEKELKDNIDLDKIVAVFEEDIQPSHNPLLMRIAGQTGTGKTTQLLPIITECLQETSFIRIAVGKFAPFHPSYKDIDNGNVRERTNGFALRAMALFLEHCIKAHTNIVLDLTLSDPVFETYIYTLAKENGYTCITNLMCVPKKVSDAFVKIREQQSGRKVLPKSAFYMFTIIPKAVKAISKLDVFDDKDKVILWSHCRLDPICVIKYNDKRWSQLLNEYRSLKYAESLNVEDLRTYRLAWMKNFMREYQQNV